MYEEWKDIVDFENLYQISNKGNFRKHPDKQGKRKNSKELLRAISINYLGYEYIDLCKKGVKSKKTVHQAVAAAFIPNFKYGMQINHIDGNKRNNSVNNLEITDYCLNNTHAHKLFLHTKPGKSKYFNVSTQLDKRHKIPKEKYIAQVTIDSKHHYIGCFNLEIDAAKAVDIFLNSIGDTQRNRNFP